MDYQKNQNHRNPQGPYEGEPSRQYDQYGTLLNALAEESATQLSEERNPEGLVQNAVITEEGAEVAKTAKEDFEKRLGRCVVTSEKAVDYIQSPEELPFNNR